MLNYRPKPVMLDTVKEYRRIKKNRRIMSFGIPELRGKLN